MGVCNRCGHADAEALMLNEDVVRQLAREGIESFTSRLEDGESFKELNELLENMQKITKGEICRCRAPHAINMEMIV
jgi:hypothetical protein